MPLYYLTDTSVDAQEDFEDYLDYPDYPADQVQPSTTSWSYQDQQSWGFHWPECRSGRQSPVDIDTSLVASTPYLNLRFSRFHQPLFGYSVRAEDRAIRLRTAFKGPGPGITGTALRWVPYQLGGMSWHWGGHRGAGSEHSFNYVQYDGELQLHFYSKKYGSLEVASLAPGSKGDNPRTSLPQPVAILSVLFKEANEPNPRLEPILEAIQVWARLTNHSSSSSSTLESSSSFEVPISEPIVLSDLFPLPDPVTDQWKVFTYRGSLNTPPCSEVVQYFVLAEVNAIGSEQVQKKYFEFFE